MNYQDYQNHLKVSEYLGKEPTGVYGDIHQLFEELWVNLHITSIGDDIFFYKNGHTFAMLVHHTGTFDYTRENFKLWDYMLIGHKVREEYASLFISLINDYLCTNTISLLDWAFEWSFNDKLKRHGITKDDLSPIHHPS
jgi:hypothetical protein